MHVKTPYYLVDERLLIRNLEILKEVREQSGAHILLASKAFSMYHCFPLIGTYLDGVTSSGLYEARLGREEMNKEVHVFSPAFKDADMEELLQISDHIVFNSLNQWERYKHSAQTKASCGLRINPQYSEIDTALYDPCAPNSRMGITKEKLEGYDLSGIEGLHFHTLCEQGAETLAHTLEVIHRDFGKYLTHMKWINLGGGHHITQQDYNIPLLVKEIKKLQETYAIDVYLEPGEAVALHCGFLTCEVLDIVENGKHTAILDASATCHMPDVLEMPYRPTLIESCEPSSTTHSYLLAGNTCLAGDVIGEYSFDHPLQIGEQLTFTDMAIYTMVKNNTFNGVPLPSIVYRKSNGELEIVKQFHYEDFKSRL